MADFCRVYPKLDHPLIHLESKFYPNFPDSLNVFYIYTCIYILVSVVLSARRGGLILIDRTNS